MVAEFIHHSPEWWSAVGTVTNAIVVIILAVLNVLYLKAAKRQATAAEEQTVEIKNQIGLSLQELAIARMAFGLSSEQTVRLRRTRVMAALSDLQQIDTALTKLIWMAEQVGANLNEVLESEFLPEFWKQIAECIEQELPDGNHDAMVLQDSLAASRDSFHRYREFRRSANPERLVRERQGVLKRQVESSQARLRQVRDSLRDALTDLKSPNAALSTANVARKEDDVPRALDEDG